MKRLATFIISATLLGGCNLDVLSQAQDAKDAATQLKNELNKLSVLVTDTLNVQYKEVWVLLYKLEATDTAGNTVVFYENPNGKALNVTTRNGIAELLNITQIKDGTYDNFSATLSAGVTIVKADGTTINTGMLSSGGAGQVSINVPGTVTIAQGSVSAIALNFDTQNFILNAQNQLEPALNLVTDTTAFNRLYGTLSGTVVSINGDQITLQPPSGPQVTVTVPGFASIVNEITGATGLTLADISIGDVLRILGNFNGNQLQVEASTIAVEAVQANEGKEIDVVGFPVEVEGAIVSVSSVDSSLVLDIHEASFLPENDQINVINLDNAVYSRGAQTMLAAGKKVEIRGTWDGSNLTAKLVEIEGAPSSGSFTTGTITGELAEVKGTVSTFVDPTLTIQIVTAEHVSLTAGDSLTVDLSSAWFKQGNAACLLAGTIVELKGTVPAADTTALDVSQIEVGGCSTLPDDSSADGNDADSGTGGDDSSTTGGDSDFGTDTDADDFS